MAAIHGLIGLQSALLSLQKHLTEHSQPCFESRITQGAYRAPIVAYQKLPLLLRIQGMVREDGRQHAAVSRILQPEDGTKNCLPLHGKRLGQNFHGVTAERASCSSMRFGQDKLFEAALTC